MPIIEINRQHFREILYDLPEEKLHWDEVKRTIPMMGASFEREDEETISFEFFPNRPDLYSVEGAARAYRSYVTSQPFSQDLYSLQGSSGIYLEVASSVLEVRPYIGCVMVRGVNIDENSLRSIMNVQEKLHMTLGRGRKKMAIGIHDFSPLYPPFRYLGANPDEVSFLPLQGDREMTLAEILKYHDKGVEYAHTLDGFPRYPVILDSKGQVLSFPPIINGELTRVTEDTTDIFVDCTGTSLRVIEESLNIITAQLIDLGGRAESVEIRYPPGAYERGESGGAELGIRETPPFEWTHLKISLKDAKRLLGVEIGVEEAIKALNRMGYPVQFLRGEVLEVSVPPMRVDILHPVDLFEDMAIGYGYGRFEGDLPKTPAFGEELPGKELEGQLRELMIGLKYQEVKTLTLVSEAELKALEMDREVGVEVINPLSEDHSALRPSLLPSLLGFLRNNRHRDFPQRVFEIGEVVRGGRNRFELWAVAVERKVGFTDVKSVAEYLMKSVGVDVKVERSKRAFFIRGRSAVLLGRAGEPLCEIGELHPEVLERYEITYPATALRIDIDNLAEALFSGG
ncbi:MAG: phenylalanine--tRNA ligase subunit beta [Thermoplasmata archaeon]|nr:phenylalanine--tRNA ligase subunit beta [Thermoplasmata archaeon]